MSVADCSTRVCELCGEPFPVTHPAKRFCCREHKELAKARRYRLVHKDDKAAQRRAQREDEAWRAEDCERKRKHWANGYGERAKHNRNTVKAEFKARGCLVCGCIVPAIIAAHHVDPAKKDVNIGDLRSADALLAELEKCVPLCLNHHQLIHIAMNNGGGGLGLGELVEYVKTQWPETL